MIKTPSGKQLKPKEKQKKEAKSPNKINLIRNDKTITLIQTVQHSVSCAAHVSMHEPQEEEENCFIMLRYSEVQVQVTGILLADQVPQRLLWKINISIIINSVCQYSQVGMQFQLFHLT